MLSRGEAGGCLSSTRPLFTRPKQIPLSQNQFAIVDDADFKQLNKFKWYVIKPQTGGFVAARNTPRVKGKRRLVLMHRVIMNTPAGMDTDHRNHDTLDNQRHNLRVCTSSENKQNSLSRKGSSSEYKGVSWHKRTQKWQARIKINGKQQYLGIFSDEETAARAYDRAARELFGEFAHCNFPEKVA